MRRGISFDANTVILSAQATGAMGAMDFGALIANKRSLNKRQLSVIGDLIRTQQVQIEGFDSSDALAQLG